MHRVQLPPDSCLIDELSVGRVLASRINDIVAKPTSRRYRNYLHLLNRQIRGFQDTDPANVYRNRDLVPAALDAYRHRHGTDKITTGWFYQHAEYPMLACVPHGVESDMIGLTVHIRESEDSYEQAIEKSHVPARRRVAQASMAVTGLTAWIHLDYWEDRGLRRRRLYESVFATDPAGDQMLWAMIHFYCDASKAHLKTA